MSTLKVPTSINNRLILEAYQKEGLKSEAKNGFAFVSQKVASKGLKVLMDAKLTDGTVILAGSTAYIKEKVLHGMPWATETYSSEVAGDSFMVVEIAYVDYVVPPKAD